MEKMYSTRIFNSICLSLVIVELIRKRRRALEKLENDFIKTSDAPGTARNTDSKMKRYLEFTENNNMKPFPVTEFKIIKFAAYLSKTMKTVESIKQYCGKICQENELRGWGKVRRGVRYYQSTHWHQKTAQTSAQASSSSFETAFIEDATSC